MPCPTATNRPDESFWRSRLPDSVTKLAIFVLNPRTETIALLAGTVRGAETEPTVRRVSTDVLVLLYKTLTRSAATVPRASGS